MQEVIGLQEVLGLQEDLTSTIAFEGLAMLPKYPKRPFDRLSSIGLSCFEGRWFCCGCWMGTWSYTRRTSDISGWSEPQRG